MSTLTKQLLAYHLKEMMCEKPINKITVKDLVKTCEINRQTFYYHFQDIYDLLAWIYKNEALSEVENFKTIETWHQGLSNIFKYIQANKNFCLNTYRSLGREHLQSFLNEMISTLLNDVIEEIEQPPILTQWDIDFIVHFYCHALTGILLDWLHTGMKNSHTEIVNNIICLMDGHFYQALERFSNRTLI